jgi:signal transduction histidine kinase/CheY-like chemotaxis protein
MSFQRCIFQATLIITLLIFFIFTECTSFFAYTFATVSGLLIAGKYFYYESIWALSNIAVQLICLLSMIIGSHVYHACFAYLILAQALGKVSKAATIVIVCFDPRWLPIYFIILTIQNFVIDFEKEYIAPLKENIDELKGQLHANETKFAALVHDLRNPLTSIMGCLELLCNMNLGCGKDLVETACDCCDIMLTLINNMLDIAKIGSKKLELNSTPVSLNSMMIKVLGIFYEKIKSKGIELKYKVSTNIPNYIIIDDSRMIQVLINMIGNAVKFTHSGEVRITVIWEGMKCISNIDLVALDVNKQFGKEKSINLDEESLKSLQPQEEDNGEFHQIAKSINLKKILRKESTLSPSNHLLKRVSQLRNESETDITLVPSATIKSEVDGLLKISIADTGIGISDDAQQQLFKPYQQASNQIYKEYGGTGLGLWLSAELIRLMKGSITYKSVLGQGTTFFIEIPVKAKDFINAENNFGPVLDYIPNLKKPILLVEDDFNRGLQLSKIFTFLGCQIKGITRYVDILKIEESSYSCVYVELLMQSNNRVKADCIKNIWSRLKNIPIIVCTDFSKEALFRNQLAITDLILHYPYKVTALSRMLISIKECNSQKPSVSNLSKAAQAEDAPIACETTITYVLIVDDNLSIRKVMRLFVNFIQKKTLKAVECQNGKEAVDAFIKYKGKVAIIFMDINMPLMSGYQAVSEILQIEAKECIKHSPVVGLSGDENVTEGEFDTTITKPLELQKFNEIIRKYCDFSKIE